jgi:hypothetical protein
MEPWIARNLVRFLQHVELGFNYKSHVQENQEKNLFAIPSANLMPKWNSSPTGPLAPLTHVFPGRPSTSNRPCRPELSLYLVDLVMGLRRSIFKNCAVTSLGVMTALEARRNAPYWRY